MESGLLVQMRWDTFLGVPCTCSNKRQASSLCSVLLLSRCLHSLVHLSLPSGLTEADARVLEEAWIYFEDALTVMGSTVSWTGGRAWLGARKMSLGCLSPSQDKKPYLSGFSLRPLPPVA